MATRVLVPLTRRPLSGLTPSALAKPALTKTASKPKTGSSERNASEWSRCKSCSREFKRSTLERNDYVCTTCTKKAQRGETGTKKNNGKCDGTCGKEYTKATLKKWDNMCKKCFDAKKSGGNDDQVVTCTACDRDVSKKISDENSGFCHTCTGLVMQFYYGESLLKVLQEDGEADIAQGEES